METIKKTSQIKSDPLAAIRDGLELTLRDRVSLILKLSFPAILAQISSIIMQYIDASMVGHLNSESSAAIGLVSSSTWLIGGIMTAFSTGFHVRVAHKIGANDYSGAKSIVKWGVLSAFFFSLVVMAISVALSSSLPMWMGGQGAVVPLAASYFLIYSLTIPVLELRLISQGMIQSSGNIRLPSILSVIMCALDVVFNALLIPRLGVAGAALGTSLAQLVIVIVLLIYLLFLSPSLHIFGKREGDYAEGADPAISGFRAFIQKEIPGAMAIAIPVGIDSIIMGFAYVAFTRIVSPHGTTALSANSFAITAESLCYMPGYGIGIAATTIVGQCIGARRKLLGKQLGYLATALGVLIMTFSGILMYIFAPQMIGILTPDPNIRELGTAILRIEAFAEPLYGASIVASGVFRGAGETLFSSVLNLLSVWCVRIPFAAFLASRYGLKGAWIAMCTELCVRGTLFLVRLVLWKTDEKPRS
jgi:putative MATE family efflux protein